VGKVADARCPRGCAEPAISPALLENPVTIRKCRHSPQLSSKKCESWQTCHNCGGCASNKQQKKTLVRSKGWLAPAESLEFTAPNELKKIKLAPRRDVNRRHPIDGAGCGSCGRGLSLRSRAVRVSTPSTLRSGCQVLGLGVSDDRVTPAPPAGVTRGLDRIACSLKPREESRDGAPRGERARSALRR